jgi:hypothetical protein
MNMVEIGSVCAKEAGVTHDEAKRAATTQTPPYEHQIIGIDTDTTKSLVAKRELTQKEYRFVTLHIHNHIPEKTILY